MCFYFLESTTWNLYRRYLSTIFTGQSSTSTIEAIYFFIADVAEWSI